MLRVIKESHELNNLFDSKKNSSKTVKLDFPDLSKEENRQYSNLINELKDECGCQMGSYFMFGSIALCTLYFWLITHSLWKIILMSSAFILFGSILGKLIGKGIAKYRLMKILKLLKEK